MKLFAAGLLLVLSIAGVISAVNGEQGLRASAFEKNEETDIINSNSNMRQLDSDSRPCFTVKKTAHGHSKPCTVKEKNSRRPASYIIGGTPVESDEYTDGVGILQVAGPDTVYTDPFCSGTLISERVVLTAAHCLDVGSLGNPIAVPPDQIKVYFGTNPEEEISRGTFNDYVVDVEETIIHPDYNDRRLLKDIALIRLAVPGTLTGSTPVPHLPSSMALKRQDIGTQLYFVGFGLDDINNPSTTVKRYGAGVTLERITKDPGLRYAQDGTNGPCYGDSGGGTYVVKDGNTFVAGAVSYGDAQCSSYGVSTKVDEFDDWINGLIGVTTSSCGDGTCDPDESCNNCVSDCGECPNECGTTQSGKKCKSPTQCISCVCVKRSSSDKFGQCEEKSDW